VADRNGRRNDAKLLSVGHVVGPIFLIHGFSDYWSVELREMDIFNSHQHWRAAVVAELERKCSCSTGADTWNVGGCSIVPFPESHMA
jgi:hypothetical protein